MPIRYLNHSMHVHTKRDIWVALLFYMTCYQTITNIVIFTQSKHPRFWSILEKQVNYICLEYKKLLSWRTSVQAAIDHLSIPRLPLWACTLHNPNKGCHAQPTIQHAQLRAILRACMLLWCARSQTRYGCFQFFKSSNLRCLNILQTYLNNKILHFFLITAVFNTKKILHYF